MVTRVVRGVATGLHGLMSDFQVVWVVLEEGRILGIGGHLERTPRRSVKNVILREGGVLGAVCRPG